MASVVGLTRVWATGPQTPNIDPGLTKWALGWIAEIPTLQVLNFINNRSDTNQLALAERGVFEWVSGIAYKLGALSWDEADSVIYRCKVSPPDSNLRPGLNSAQWEPSSIQISRFAYDANAAAWAAHTANTANPHQLTAHQLQSYTVVEIDAKVGAVQTDIDAHVSIVAGNPHNTTSADVGAVPIVGGTYTGVVNHRYASTTMGPLAQAGSINALTSGITIGKGPTARLGLNASSQPIAIDEAGVVTVLLTEASYVAQRTAQAPLYATPAPDSWFIAKNGLQLPVGVGAVSFTGAAGRTYTGKDGVTTLSTLNVPRLSPNGMRLTAAEDVVNYPVLNNLQGFPNWTLAMDFRSSTGDQTYVQAKTTTAAAYGYFCQIGTGLYYVFYSVGGVAQSLKLADIVTASDHKVAATYDGTTLRVYLDGALANSYVVTPEPFTANAGGVAFGASGSSGATFFLREFRTWNKALTDKQISQL